VAAPRFALEKARFRGAGLTVVQVWQQPYSSEDVGPDAASSLDEPARTRAEQLLQDQVGKARRQTPTRQFGSGGRNDRSAKQLAAGAR
jgi:hypothetical protein